MSVLNVVMSPIEKFAAPIGRLFIALIFVMSGLNKMGSYSAWPVDGSDGRSGSVASACDCA